MAQGSGRGGRLPTLLMLLMGYVDANLSRGENIVHQARLHWAFFLRPVLIVLLGLAIRGEFGMISSSPTPS
jgi:hypothetical protein